MDFRSLLQTMYTINEGETKETSKGREHKGTYGTSHGKEDVRDQYGHKIGKVNKDTADKKSDAPKKRGRPTKAAKDSTGADIKHDTSGIQAMLGGKPKGEVGKKSVKHSLKDWIESLDTDALNEDGQYVTKPIPQQATQMQQVIGPDGRPALNQPIPTSAALRVANALSSSDGSQGMAEGGKVDRMVKHVKSSEKKLGHSDKEAENIAWATANKRGMLDNKNKKVDEAVAEAKDLPGKQEKLDVAKPKGKLTSADFKALSAKKKVKESQIMQVVEGINFRELMANADSEIQEMLIELQNDIEAFKETGHSSELLDSFLKVHLHHNKKKITDEGSIENHTERNALAIKPSRIVGVGVNAVPTSFGTDPIQAVTDRGINATHSMGKKASGFLKSLSPFSMKESKDMKDIQVESWEKELNSLLNEGITVSSSTGQQGSPDSVSINATDADAQELLAIVRQAGLGVFGGDKPQSNYGAPMHDNPEGHGTEPEMAPDVVGDDSDMLALIKKMTGIDMGTDSEEGSMDNGQGNDYEDEEGQSSEEGSEDTALQPADDEEQDSGEESEEGDEKEVGENLVPVPNPSGASSADDAKRLGGMMPKPSSSSKDPISKLTAEYPGGSTDFNTGEVKTTGGTNEGEMEEGNKFTEKLKKTPQGGTFSMGGKQYTDTSNIEEGDNETCNECGSSMYEGHECETEAVEEGYSNETGHEELAQLKALLSMGNDMHRPKNSQATGNVQKVTMETKLMKQSSDLLVDFRKLSGIK